MNKLQLDPAIITIFGITGDLAKRKLLPALYGLVKDGLLPDDSKIVGVTRRGMEVDQVIDEIRSAVESRDETCDQKTLDWIKDALSIEKMDLTDEKEYDRLKEVLDGLEDSVGSCLTRVFYLAIPAGSFEQVVGLLGKAKLNTGCQHGSADSRLMIEKPFGFDLESAKLLINQLQQSFTEEQLYRIDHYLAKETAQNILAFRFQNPLFMNAWDNTHISHILVTASESIGIEGRADFYEETGALRDIIQSHLLQLVALVTMDSPDDMSAEHIHAKKAELLNSLQPPTSQDMSHLTVRAQYDTYKEEVDNQNSTTETYAAVKLTIDNQRWQGVPILVRTGKALGSKVTEIRVVYQDREHMGPTNDLTIRIQPNEGIVLDLRIKKPGFEDETEHVQMDFCYGERFSAVQTDAYQRVIVDALRGDKTLFATSEEVLASWRITEPILEAWKTDNVPLLTYESGSAGPDEAELMAVNARTSWQSHTLHTCSVHPHASNSK